MNKLVDIVHHLRSKESLRGLERRLGISRNTVRSYRAILAARGLLNPDVPMPDAGTLASLIPEPDPSFRAVSTVAPYHETIKELIDAGCECTAVWRRLQERFEFAGGYDAVKRYCRKNFRKRPEVFCRMESIPGEAANVDFGYAGLVNDPKRGGFRKVWFFLMTLAWSRHMFVRFVFDQKQGTFLGCIEAAFKWFGGVPAELVTDNLKSAVLLADMVDPVIGEPYRRLARHYGFRAHPIRPRTPRHNGKAESGVAYLKGNFLAGQTFADIDAMNDRGQVWVLEVAGPRCHGTTMEIPLERFEKIERGALKSLPETRFDIPVAHRVVAANDGRVMVDRRRYTVPPEYVGRTLEAYDNGRIVEIVCGFDLVTTHAWVEKPGGESVRLEHLPEYKREVVEMTPARCREEANKVGTHCRAAIDRLLDDPEQNRLSAARCLLRLGRAHGKARLEESCRRLILVDDISYRRAKTMLRNEADLLPFGEAPPVSVVSRSYRYARPGSCFFERKVSTS